MMLPNLTYTGPAISDFDILTKVTGAYKRLLREINGFIAFGGGLHIRGATISPKWHSLSEVWVGDRALFRLFPALQPTDIPFGQDYLGDQFILRENVVYRLSGETGGLQTLKLGLNSFLKRAHKDPMNFLALQPLLQFVAEQGELRPGQLVNVLPPFIMKESEDGVSMRAIPVFDQIPFLADLSRQINGLPDGSKITLEVLKKPLGH